MKKNKIIVAEIFCVLCMGCSINSLKDASNEAVQEKRNTGAYLKIEADNCDFGNINMKEDLTKEIEFCNCGDSALVIYKIDVSCSCVKVTFSEKPIKSNEKGCIKINLDPKGQKGHIHKKIYIQSNARNNVEILYVKANII